MATSILLISPVQCLSAEKIDPVIPPGHVPKLNSDERGLWMEIGEYEQSIRKSPLLVTDYKLRWYVEDVTCRVAGPYCSDLRVYVIRNPGFNASMAPNGMMQIWTGLLLRVTSEDELASVIGHEIAHYAMGHTLDRFRRLRTSTGLGALFSLGLGVATGVLVPVGEMMAVADAMAFSSSQEQEADLMGVQLMEEAGFNPSASYLVWENLQAEERAAAVKSDEPGFFAKTHPDIDKRIVKLREWVAAGSENTEAVSVIDDTHRAALSEHYTTYMEDQIDTNRHGRTAFLLDRHEDLGISNGYVNFFRGEMYRQRGEPGDTQMAVDSYLAAIQSDEVPSQAYRNLGYLALKRKDPVTMAEMFRLYLEIDPEASDREMIEFYLEN
jgi:hypothetical protein